MQRKPSELRRIARSATPTDARRPPGLRTSVVLTKFPNSEQAPLWKLRQAERALADTRLQFDKKEKRKLIYNTRKIESDKRKLNCNTRKIESDRRKLNRNTRKIEIVKRKLNCNTRKIENDRRKLIRNTPKLNIDKQKLNWDT